MVSRETPEAAGGRVCASSRTGHAPTRVLIVDDHPLIIDELRRRLAGADDLEVVADAHSAPEAREAIKGRTIDVALIDLRLPTSEIGLELIRWLRAERPQTRVVVLSASDDQASINSALQAGASAYVVKSAHVLDIEAVLRQPSNGAVFFGPAARPVDDSDGDGDGLRMNALSRREREVLAALVSGQSSAAIAGELGISDSTVKFHLAKIYRKLGVTTRTAAVRFALTHEPRSLEP